MPFECQVKIQTVQVVGTLSVAGPSHQGLNGIEGHWGAPGHATSQIDETDRPSANTCQMP